MSSRNEPLSSLTHLIASILSVIGLALLVTLAGIEGKTIQVVGFAIFGASLILLYLMSTIYHFIAKDSRAKRVFQILDHSTIYLLIAGTYTPLVLTALPPAWGWSLFGVIWGLALVGVLKKSLQLPLPAWVSPVFYVIMGWLIVVAIVPLKAALPLEGLLWLLAGGIFYTVGTIFFALDKYISLNKWYTLHDIFHILVMLGSFCHFWFMLKYILPL
jgi:hemolysin III